MNKKKMLIISIFTSIVILIAYYIFFISTDSNKNVVDMSDFEVQFYKIGIIEEHNSNGASASISYDKKFVYISVPNLMSPGAYALIPITVENVGTRTSRLDSITEYGFDYNSSINIKYENLSVINSSLKPGDKMTFYVIIKWDENAIINDETVNIKIKLNYVQDEGGIIWKMKIWENLKML